MAQNEKRLDISELDFDNIKTNLKTFLQGQSEFADYDFEGSGMNILLDVLAYNTHYLAFNANMAANEMFLDSSSLRSSVVSHAKTLGYEVGSVKAPYATVNVTLDSHTTSTATLPIATRFTTTVDSVEYSFLNTEEYTAPKSGNDVVFNNVKIYEGTYITTRYTVATSNVNQRFVIPDSRVDTDTLLVKVQTSSSDTSTTTYTKATDITQLTDSSSVYFLQEIEAGKFEVYFGDGVVSKSLSDGNIVLLSYVVTNQDVANGASSFSSAGAIAGNSVVVVTTVASAIGGGERETINSVKLKAPLNYASQGRCVTTDDYKVYTSKLFTLAKTVQVFGGEDGSFDSTLGVVSTPQYGKVFISVRTISGNNMTSAQKNNLVNDLKKFNVASITPVIVDPEVTYLILQTTFKYNSNITTLTAVTLESNVRTVLTDYNTNKLTDFNKPFRHSELTRLVDTTDNAILNSSINVTLAKYVTPTLNVSTSYNMYFNNKFFNPHSGHNASSGGIVASTGFLVSGDTTNINYFDDDGAGNIRRYYYTGSTRTYVDNVAGTIDYDTGHIVINPIIITTVSLVDDAVSDKFRITVIPNSKDITPVRNQLLEIDTVNSPVTGTVDTIAIANTGGATNYITPSNLPDTKAY